MRTIAQKSRTNRRDSRNARCGVSSRPLTCNGSRRSTVSFGISSQWVGICSDPRTTVCCGSAADAGVRRMGHGDVRLLTEGGGQTRSGKRVPSPDQVDSQPTRPFVGRWYLAGAVSLTVLWLVVRGFAPATGLTRSYPASAAVARARSHDHGREDARPAPLEEGGRLPSPGSGGECVLSVQIDYRGSASRPVPRRASGRVRGRV